MTPNSQSYKLTIPKQATGANLVYMDLFNAAGSGFNLIVNSVLPIVSGAVAVTGVLGVDLFLTYTSAVGTGGTAATLNGTDLTAATITAANPRAPVLSGKVTARLTPSGGATAAGLLAMTEVFTEETGLSYLGNSVDFLNRTTPNDPIVIPEGFGIRVVQGAVASVGNIAVNICFDTQPSQPA